MAAVASAPVAAQMPKGRIPSGDVSARLFLANEGRQPPCLALGDATFLDTGMCFSAEPGLFDPATGVGASCPDGFVVQSTGPARQMSRLPWSEEWGFISI